MSYTSRLNINRGFMKLDVWKEAVELLRLTYRLLKDTKVDFKLRSQIFDSVQSVSSNISEGYGRRSIGEYLQFLNFALGSSAESLTRMIGLSVMEIVAKDKFEEWDQKHYSMENKLLGLVRSLESKRKEGSWNQELPPAHEH